MEQRTLKRIYKGAEVAAVPVVVVLLPLFDVEAEAEAEADVVS
jgi:hypothetical protein